jgi:hypothetical protein
VFAKLSQVDLLKFEILLGTNFNSSSLPSNPNCQNWRIAMFSQFLDHGLPLVALKEQRRDLVVALMGRHGPLSKEKIAEIAAIEQAIAAVEAVICDLDAEVAAFEKPILTIASICGQAH